MSAPSENSPTSLSKTTITNLTMTEKPTKYAVALFNGFQALDVFGPLDMLNQYSMREKLELSVLGPTLDPVSTLAVGSPTTIGQSVAPTHTYETAPDDIEVLIVPGGRGTRNEEPTQIVVDFIKSRYPKLRFLLTICTGSALAARSGVLDGIEATTNKKSFKWVVGQGPNVRWIKEARWVTSGNIWTSSGISAGIDMMLAFMASQYGEDVTEEIAIASEYHRNRDGRRDQFAQYWP